MVDGGASVVVVVGATVVVVGATVVVVDVVVGATVVVDVVVEVVVGAAVVVVVIVVVLVVEVVVGAAVVVVVVVAGVQVFSANVTVQLPLRHVGVLLRPLKRVEPERERPDRLGDVQARRVAIPRRIVRPVVVGVVHVPRLIEQEQIRVGGLGEVERAVDPGADGDVENVALDEGDRPVDVGRVRSDRDGQRVGRRRADRPEERDQIGGGE